MTTRIDYTQPQQGGLGFARTKKTFGRRVNLATTDLATGAVTAAFKVPAGFTVTGIIAVASDMDSNGSPTLGCVAVSKATMEMEGEGRMSWS